MTGVSYRYLAHGFTLDSEIALPELAPFDGVPDIIIRYGHVPAPRDGSVTRGRRYQAASGDYLLDLPRIARYWVRHGRDVVIAPAAGATDEAVRAFVLSSVMAALAHQSGALPLHASAVEIDGRCVLFAGSSGAGKSTLAGAFYDRGYRLVTDDVSVISFDSHGYPVMHDGTRHLKRQVDSPARLDAALEAGRGSDSSAVPGTLAPGPRRIGLIFTLESQSSDIIELRPVNGHAKVAALVGDTYRRPMSVALGQHRSQFAQCAAVCQRVPVVLVRRPISLGQLPELVGMLEQRRRAAAAEQDR